MLKPNYRNSIELETHASNELHHAIEIGQDKLKFVIYNKFPEDVERIKAVCNKYSIKEITEKIRAQFIAYNIKSIVGVEGELKGVITFEEGPCIIMKEYPLVWTLTLAKKQ